MRVVRGWGPPHGESPDSGGLRQTAVPSRNPKHFLWSEAGKVATVTLNRPERKNPLTFESYAELRDTFRSLKDDKTVKTIVLTGAGENFCSGGDVHEIIGPLVE
jgi:enoyl-CoA hydratase/carnithine racemase